MKQSIEFVGEFIHITDNSGEIFVIPKIRFPGSTIHKNESGSMLIYHGGEHRHPVGALVEFARSYSITNERYIICNGKFLDVKRVCATVGIYIDNDEIIDRVILKRFSHNDQNQLLLDGVLVNNKNFEIPALEWKEPMESHPITRDYGKFSHILINGYVYSENGIKQRLKDYGYKQDVDLFICDGSCIQVGERLFSGKFLNRIMISGEPSYDHNVAMEKFQSKLIKSTELSHYHNVPSIVGFRREEKKTVTIYSDCTVKINMNDDSSDPVLSTECENILMYCTKTHLVLNCSGKLRNVNYSNIHLMITNFDGARICILGDNENLTEVIKIHCSINDDIWKTIKETWNKYSPTFDRS